MRGGAPLPARRTAYRAQDAFCCRGSRLLGRRRAGAAPRVGRRGERGPGYRAVSLKRRREILRYWLSVRSWPVQRVIADGGPGEQRGGERRSGGDGHRDREAGCHSGRVFEGGAGKPRGEGESRDRDHLTETRKSVVNGGRGGLTARALPSASARFSAAAGAPAGGRQAAPAACRSRAPRSRGRS
jgi:hypothetical protein